MVILDQIRNAYRKWMGKHRLIEIQQNGKTSYMVQQAVFGFWWMDRYTQPFEDYDKAKSHLEECAAVYAPIAEKVISVKAVIPDEQEKRMWETPSRPITPTPKE